MGVSGRSNFKSCLVWLVFAINICSRTEAKSLISGGPMGWTDKGLDYNSPANLQTVEVGDVVVFNCTDHAHVHDLHVFPSQVAYDNCYVEDNVTNVPPDSVGTFSWTAPAAGVYFFGCLSKAADCAAVQKMCVNVTDADCAPTAATIPSPPSPPAFSPLPAAVPVVPTPVPILSPVSTAPFPATVPTPVAFLRPASSPLLPAHVPDLPSSVSAPIPPGTPPRVPPHFTPLPGPAIPAVPVESPPVSPTPVLPPADAPSTLSNFSRPVPAPIIPSRPAPSPRTNQSTPAATPTQFPTGPAPTQKNFPPSNRSPPTAPTNFTPSASPVEKPEKSAGSGTASGGLSHLVIPASVLVLISVCYYQY